MFSSFLCMFLIEFFSDWIDPDWISGDRVPNMYYLIVSERLAEHITQYCIFIKEIYHLL